MYFCGADAALSRQFPGAFRVAERGSFKNAGKAKVSHTSCLSETVCLPVGRTLLKFLQNPESSSMAVKTDSS
ncbi:hypothetical protein AMECASPLE_037484 [Ameca splendens]|uniref:Uncharacterized protein n=1 Tax=Ameca splendens TaxID=208324 RepID=A0ABV0ZJ54_9TELE